jgi:hypothetical protein
MHPRNAQPAIDMRMTGTEPSVKKNVTQVQVRIDDLAQRTLIQAGDFRILEEQVKELAERASSFTTGQGAVGRSE